MLSQKFINLNIKMQAHVDFQRLCEEWLTGVHGGLLVMATGLIFRDMGRAKALGFMMVIRMEAAQKHVITKSIGKYGGPGNRTQVPLLA